MSFRLLVCACLFIGFQSAGALAQEPGNVPEPKQEPGPAAPAAEAAAQPAATPEAVQPPPAAPEPAAPPAPAVAPVATPAVAAAPPPSQLDDQERAPDHVILPPPPGLFARVAVGIGVSLLATGEESVLRTPGSALIDIGYGFTPDFAALLRVSTWLSFEKAALAFLGAGARFGVAPESMFVTTLLGVSIFSPEGAFAGNESVQGLALQVEIGQAFVLSGVFNFEIGARFELGTPLFAGDVEFTSIGIGPFLAFRVGG